MTPTKDDELMLLRLAVHKAAQEAERAAVQEYAEFRDPKELLFNRIREAIACSASMAIDCQPPQRAVVSEPLSWRENMSKTASRLQADPLFSRLVQAQTHQIMQEVERYEKGVGERWR